MNSARREAQTKRSECIANNCPYPNEYITPNSGPEVLAKWNAYFACHSHCLRQTPYTAFEIANQQTVVGGRRNRTNRKSRKTRKSKKTRHITHRY